MRKFKYIAVATATLALLAACTTTPTTAGYTDEQKNREGPRNRGSHSRSQTQTVWTEHSSPPSITLRERGFWVHLSARPLPRILTHGMSAGNSIFMG